MAPRAKIATARCIQARRWAAAAAAMIVALVLVACGNGSSSSGTESTAASSPSASAKAGKESKTTEPKESTEPTETKEPKETKGPKETKDPKEPSAEFAGKGENGELATAGTESTVEEREAASEVVEESLTAAANGEWAKQCATLAGELVEALANRSKAAGRQGCAKNLKLTGEAIGGAPPNQMVEPLAALRVNGNLGFAFFHGEEKDFVIPMARENGQWKVAALGPQDAP